MPLGIHRKSGQRYHFIERQPTGLATLTQTDEQRATWLASITRMDVPQPVKLQPTLPAQPNTTSFSLPKPRATNGPSPIRQWNAEQDHYQVIGRYVDLNANGVGKCPLVTIMLVAKIARRRSKSMQHAQKTSAQPMLMNVTQVAQALGG
ncbi:hypothetical protein [Dictyobacter formicarum]|uniref:PH domain-containing protein n=1 Tax=Dictyobacter formicarum TaxID=2778368 RepID=A0ABQ3VIU3_9CHLR|nr:hypothetical protein [Dictyobacter formicarum]GHO85596.1 hypothetical protein KSZ_36020 [Dictyobacter formicarum]